MTGARNHLVSPQPLPAQVREDTQRDLDRLTGRVVELEARVAALEARNLQTQLLAGWQWLAARVLRGWTFLRRRQS